MTLLGCQAEQSASVSAGGSTTFKPEHDTRPEVFPLFPGDILEDTESNWIFLSYSDRENHVPTSCQISDRQYVNVSYPCTCAFGSCYVKVTPFEDYSGPVSFKYSVTANNLTSLGALVSFNVIPVAEIPVANARTISIIENTSYVSNGTLSAPNLSGSDPDGDPITCIKVTDPSSGVVVVNADCSFSYTPVANFEGTVEFTFKVNDGSNDSLPATVTINVLHLNVDPVADNITVTTFQNVARNFIFTYTDADPSDPWEVIIVSGPSNGTLTGSGFTRTYTPNNNFLGNDLITYRIYDGTSNSNLATVSITVSQTTIYLRTSGNDATAVVNDPLLPFLTAKAAADSASSLQPSLLKPVIIDVGAGSFGDMDFSYNFGSYITWRGAGAGVSIIGNITVNGLNGADGVASGDPAAGDWDGEPGTNAFNLTIDSDFTLTFGNISANGGNGGLHAPDTVTAESVPGNPGLGGSVTLRGYFGTISTVGGNGHGGGAGGPVTLRTGSTSLGINASGGFDLCTTISFCGTSQNSGGGGLVVIQAGSVVTGNVITKGGENNGNVLTDDEYTAGPGGRVFVIGTVNGNVEANGGDTYDSEVGMGGRVEVYQTGVVSGDVSVLTGVYSNAGSPNFAGYVLNVGSVQDIYAHSFSATGGGGGTVEVMGTARDVFVQSYNSSCTLAAAGDVYVYIPATVRNVDASGGNKDCDTAGFINIFGTVTGTASVDGGNSVTAELPGKAGNIRLNNGASVNILSARGGDASPGTMNNGGNGGVVDIYPVSSYNLLNIDVSGGAGDTINGNVAGADGTITEF
jgi:hypothetical protein